MSSEGVPGGAARGSKTHCGCSVFGKRLNLPNAAASIWRATWTSLMSQSETPSAAMLHPSRAHSTCRTIAGFSKTD